MNNFMRFLTSPLVRLGVTCLCLYVLFRTVRAQRVFEHLWQASPVWLAVAAGLTCISVLCSIFIWGLMLKACGHSLPGRKLASFYLQGLFFAHVVPGGVGGDAVRTVFTAQLTGEGPALASLAASRLAEAVAIAVFALIATVQLHARLGPLADVAATVLACALACVWVLVFKSAVLAKAMPAAGPLWVVRCAELVRSFAISFDSYRQRKASLLLAILIGAFSWGCNLLALKAFAHAVGADVGWSAFAVCIPLSAATLIAPFAVNGMGLREGVLVAILVTLGVHTSEGFAIALLVDFQFLPFVLLGAACWLFGRRQRQ